MFRTFARFAVLAAFFVLETVVAEPAADRLAHLLGLSAFFTSVALKLAVFGAAAATFAVLWPADKRLRLREPQPFLQTPPPPAPKAVLQARAARAEAEAQARAQPFADGVFVAAFHNRGHPGEQIDLKTLYPEADGAELERLAASAAALRRAASGWGERLTQGTVTREAAVEEMRRGHPDFGPATFRRVIDYGLFLAR